jgi:putative transcriptional regulator
MKKGSTTRFRLDSKKPPKSDWRAFDAMAGAERRRAALSDPDAQPATEAQLARARRVPTVRALRQKLNLTQEEFAARFHLPLGTVRDWEQGAHRPDRAAQVLLTVIARDPDAVARALESPHAAE